MSRVQPRLLPDASGVTCDHCGRVWNPAVEGSGCDSCPAEVSPERFDGATVWRTLSAEHQAAIGAAALELVAARNCLDETYPGPRQTPAHRAAEAAMEIADDLIDQVFVQAVPQELLTDDADRVKLPACVGMVCRVCGCTQDDACAGGCGWAEDGLCTSCAPTGGAAS